MRRLRLTARADIEVIPTATAGLDMAHCLMFYECRRSLGANWLGAVESLFAAQNELPATIAGAVNDSKVSGSYHRAKPKLVHLLKQYAGDAEPDIRIDSEVAFSTEEFFPCRMRVAWSTSIGGIVQGVLAVREKPGTTLATTIDAVAPLVFREIGDAYAHAFSFPAAYGPDFYLSSVGAVLPGESSTANAMYNKRITQWRDKTWHERKRPSQGYIREVYPINFITGEQLSIEINDVAFIDYMKSVGRVRKCDYGVDLYRWDVCDGNLEQVRQELEQTGVVLSAVAV